MRWWKFEPPVRAGKVTEALGTDPEETLVRANADRRQRDAEPYHSLNRSVSSGRSPCLRAKHRRRCNTEVSNRTESAGIAALLGQLGTADFVRVAQSNRRSVSEGIAKLILI